MGGRLGSYNSSCKPSQTTEFADVFVTDFRKRRRKSRENSQLFPCYNTAASRRLDTRFRGNEQNQPSPSSAPQPMAGRTARPAISRLASPCEQTANAVSSPHAHPDSRHASSRPERRAAARGGAWRRRCGRPSAAARHRRRRRRQDQHARASRRASDLGAPTRSASCWRPSPRRAAAELNRRVQRLLQRRLAAEAAAQATPSYAGTFHRSARDALCNARNQALRLGLDPQFTIHDRAGIPAT